MPTARRTRTIHADPEAVWAVVADPFHLPRWWPRVRAVESVAGGRWTAVMTTQKGKAVRADYVLVESEPPLRRVWAQELEGSPFERVLSQSLTEVSIAPDDGATRVQIAV